MFICHLLPRMLLTVIIFSVGSIAWGDSQLGAKKYVGSELCRTCHLEHYDAWKRTLHSKMLQDVSKNADVIVTDLTAWFSTGPGTGQGRHPYP